MSTLYLPDQHARILDEMEIRLQDSREAQGSGLFLYLAATFISLALVALCWLLSPGSGHRTEHLNRVTPRVTNQAKISEISVPTPLAAAIQLNFCHGDMPMLPVFNLKDARPLQ
jgi:hypothetical protein